MKILNLKFFTFSFACWPIPHPLLLKQRTICLQCFHRIQRFPPSSSISHSIPILKLQQSSRLHSEGQMLPPASRARTQLIHTAGSLEQSQYSHSLCSFSVWTFRMLAWFVTSYWETKSSSTNEMEKWMQYVSRKVPSLWVGCISFDNMEIL